MKYVKMLGLAAITAAALTAFVGAGTASATVLCKNNLNTNVCSERYSVGTKIEGKLVGVGKMDTSFKTIECNKGSASGTLEKEGSATSTPFGGGVGTLEECNCEVKIIKNGTLEIHWIEKSDNGTLTSSGAEATVSCNTIFGNVHCIYASNNTHAGVLVGGNPATEEFAVNAPRLTTSGLCAEQGTLTGKYEVTSPKPLYIAAS
ncbi:MAG TPA: hypothetical protein VFJ65_01950 [Solirubrobacterales bacterium]|nr:hypothetical protein [Solirubrobacterales bacterium]